MKNLLLVLFVLSNVVFSQNNYLVEKLNSRIRFSGDIVKMNDEPNIGFIGHGYEVFGLLPQKENVYFGVNSYSALTGIRSGFIVFGVSGGVQKNLFSDWLDYDLGLFLGGGGGSGAPDGGGLMVRPHLDLQAKISDKLSLRAGVSAVKFPSGEINSFHINVGAVIHTHTYVTHNTSSSYKENSNSIFKDIDISMLSMNLFNYSKGPLKTDFEVDKSAPVISLLGVMLKSHQENNLYGIVKVGGAFIGEVDGFMMLLSGIGYELPVNKWLMLDAKALVGGAGGGAVQFGGGLATQIEAGIGVNISDYLFQVNLGNTYAPNGNFQSNHLDVSVGKKFGLYSNSSNDKITVVNKNDVEKEDFSFSTFNRVYVSSGEIDKIGREYDRVFNLIGFEVEKNINKNFSLIAATVWAYQGNYGAYAEGWLGLQYYYSLAKNWKITTKTLLGAGGGGNINLGSGMAYQYALGVQKKINTRWSFIANLGQIRPVSKGNFTPVLVDLGLKINISQLVKK
ncbi:hypothetical protein FHR24_000771 [Wenyingzhuangia heitensis]|uniref:DUF5723 domain-containing protein n=1 Tax=Wenyingzhuangia heitensis TaxID=1487859 RepID=A0ABX0U661_9FLAO|nr:hypothetical protein [Wenyingzhuangia heitensis]NIJ44332.1 hypothetical protein [Wenyingzhuangia heitensis]